MGKQEDEKLKRFLKGTDEKTVRINKFLNKKTVLEGEATRNREERKTLGRLIEDEDPLIV